MKQGTSPSKAILRVELQEEVRRVVDLLKENEREVLWMHYEDQLSFAQIGLVLDISANAATLRHLRALKRLRELWNKLNAEWSVTDLALFAEPAAFGPNYYCSWKHLLHL